MPEIRSAFDCYLDLAVGRKESRVELSGSGPAARQEKRAGTQRPKHLDQPPRTSAPTYGQETGF